MQLGLLGIGGISGTYYYYDELRTVATGTARFGRAALKVTQIVLDYRRSLYSDVLTPESSNYADI